MDPPAPETMMRALELLHYLGALDRKGRLTQLGKVIAEFPLDPQLSKVLIMAPMYRCVPDILTIVSMLSTNNVFIRSKENKAESDILKQNLAQCEGDHLTLLKIYNLYVENLNRDVQWCSEHNINVRSMKQAVFIREQLEKSCIKLSIDTRDHISQESSLYLPNIRKCILSGFFMQVAYNINGIDEIIYRKNLFNSERQPISNNTSINYITI